MLGDGWKGFKKSSRQSSTHFFGVLFNLTDLLTLSSLSVIALFSSSSLSL